MTDKSNWIKDAIQHKGILRRKAKQLKLIKGNEPLSESDLAVLENLGGVWAKRVALARTLKGFHDRSEVQQEKFEEISDLASENKILEAKDIYEGLSNNAKEKFADWFTAFHHYDALDDDTTSEKLLQEILEKMNSIKSKAFVFADGSAYKVSFTEGDGGKLIPKLERTTQQQRTTSILLGEKSLAEKMLKKMEEENVPFEIALGRLIKAGVFTKIYDKGGNIAAIVYIVDVMYRDGDNYKYYAENVAVPVDYVKDKGVPKVGDEITMEELGFSASQFYNLVGVKYDSDVDHNILEILEVKPIDQVEASEVTHGPRPYKKMAAGGGTSEDLVGVQEISQSESFYAAGGKTHIIAIDDYVEIIDPKDALYGSKGIVVDFFDVNNSPHAEVLLTLIKQKEGNPTIWNQGDTEPFRLNHLKNFGDICALIETGKQYNIEVPEDIDNPRGPKKKIEVTVIAFSQADGMFMVTAGFSSENGFISPAKNSTYQVYPEDLIGNGVEQAVTQNPSSEFVEFKGEKYPVRTIVIQGGGLDEPTEVTIGNETLQAALKKSKWKGAAGKIDEGIYYYVPDQLLATADDETLAKNLDEVFEIAPEEQYKGGGPAKAPAKKKILANQVKKHVKDATNFDIRISRTLAEKILNEVVADSVLMQQCSIMCKEMAEDGKWANVKKSDLVNKKLPTVYKTFEIWINGNLDKAECHKLLETLL